MIPKNFTPEIHRFDSLDSTNAAGKAMAAKGTSEGTVIVAKSQTAGRGRGKRVWHSPDGGLYTSILVYPKDSKRPQDLSLLAGVAVVQAIREILPKSIDITLKWPNDILVNWKKSAGILCESLGEEYFNLCVIGIGINVNTSDAELNSFRNNPFPATSLRAECGGGVLDMEVLLQMLLNKFFNLYRAYHEEGFSQIAFLWERNCAFIGKKVELKDSGWRDGEETQKRDIGVTVGTFLGIDESGGIVLSNAKGERRHYVSGEITCVWH